ncbi:MAG TPA: prepilin-type N-terminal cleavage/methylation domain-containing protein [Malonomonas sp.]
MRPFFSKIDQRGFTLIELLVVVAIFGVIMAGIFGVYLSTQRTANTEERVVDLKQNQRVGLESITRDLRWAGFLIRTSDNPIQTAASNTLVINTISGTRKAAQIDAVSATQKTFVSPSVITTEQVISLKEPINLKLGDFVRIIRPANASQPVQRVLTLTEASSSTTLKVTGFNSAEVIGEGDIVAEYVGDPTATPTDATPNTITYALNGTDLKRHDGVTNETVASGVSGLTFSYLLDDGTEPADPTTISDLSDIRAVRVTLEGEVTTASGIKRRGMTSTIALRNR